MNTITLTGGVVVTDDATEKPITDPKKLRAFDGLNSGRETCAKYHSGEVADLELKGGAVTLVFDKKTNNLRVVSVFTGPRKLTAKELAALIDDTEGQWSDGIGEGCFDTVMDKRGVFIDLYPDRRGKTIATQAVDGKPPPKKSSAALLVKAAATGNLDAVKKLVAAKAKLDTRGGQYGWTPLIAAIAGDHTEVALYLIEQGADPNVTSKDKDSPLKWVALRSGWVKKQNVELAAALLDAGAEIDAPDKDGMTPLIWAANRRSARLVELLLARGADVEAKTTQKHNVGRTALMMTDDLATVRVLLDAGADPKAVDENGYHTWDHKPGAAAKLLREKAGQ